MSLVLPTSSPTEGALRLVVLVSSYSLVMG
jgi:hypothetical protein